MEDRPGDLPLLDAHQRLAPDPEQQALLGLLGAHGTGAPRLLGPVYRGLPKVAADDERHGTPGQGAGPAGGAE